MSQPRGAEHFQDVDRKLHTEDRVKASQQQRQQVKDTGLPEQGMGEHIFFRTDLVQHFVLHRMIHAFGERFQRQHCAGSDQENQTDIQAKECDNCAKATEA